MLYRKEAVQDARVTGVRPRAALFLLRLKCDGTTDNARLCNEGVTGSTASLIAKDLRVIKINC